jgi:glucokinase
MKVIVLDVGGTKISSAIIKDGNLKGLKKVKTKNCKTKKEFIEQIVDIVNGYFDDDVDAISLGVPGVVKKGVISGFNNIGNLKNINLKKVLEKKFNVKIFIENDANCFALGSSIFGIAKKKNYVLGLILGTGFGFGYVVNDKFISGSSGGFGQIGDIPYLGKTFEDFCSGKFFEDNGVNLAKVNIKSFNNLNHLFDSYGEHLANAIVMIVRIIDPSCIVLGGSVSKLFKYFKKSMFKILKEHDLNIKIVVEKNKDVALFGSYYVALNE